MHIGRNGPEWWRLRKEFQKALSKPQSIVTYVEDTDQVVKEFVDLCQHEEHTNEDLLPLLSRLFLERKKQDLFFLFALAGLSLMLDCFPVTCLVAFDVKLNSFSNDEMQKNSRSSRLIEAAFETNSAILKLDNGPRLWRFFDTPLFKKFSNSQRLMER